MPPRAPVSFAHTPAYPAPGNKHIASTKYSPARDGSARSRCSRVHVSSSTASASSNGITRVSSPRCPGANTPAATVIVVVMAVTAERVAD